MAARAQREAQRLSKFCRLVVNCLFFLSLLTRNSLGYILYSRQQLLDIGFHNPDNFIGDLRLTPEIAKTTESTSPATLIGGVEIVNKDGGRE